jgi:exosome complex exonuclease RRP6
MKSLIDTTKASNNIMKTDPSADVNQNLDIAKELMIDIFQLIDKKNSICINDDFMEPSIYEHVVDMIDSLLLNADLKFDILKANDLSKSIKLSLDVDKTRILNSSASDNVPKPQLAFYSEIDNSRFRPFHPKLKIKHWAQVPLDLTEHVCPNIDPDVISPTSFYRHPYETELIKLRYPEKQMLDASSIQAWRAPPSQPFEYIDKETDLYRVLDELQECFEIAVDLEHNSYRSFLGITCLMQVYSVYNILQHGIIH